MGESMDSLFRRGMISKGQADRIGKPKILAQTRVERADEEPFDNKAGRGDQGGIRDRGIPHANRRAIDNRQDMGTPDRASGKPSKGGSVQGPARQPVRSREIDDGRQQKPDFPREGRVRGSEARRPYNKRARGKVERAGGYYGGGGQDTQ